MNRPTLSTDRLILRPFVPDDAADVTRLVSDRRIADTTINIPHPYDQDMAEAWIAKHAEMAEQDEGLTLAVTLRGTGALIGAVALAISRPSRRAELGYWVGVEFWGQGYATEAASAIIDHAFTTLDLRRVVAHCLTRNPGSWRVMEKLGMQREGRLRQHVIKWDVPEDIWLFGILREEWPNVSRAGAPYT